MSAATEIPNGDLGHVPWHRMLKYQARVAGYVLRRRWWQLTPWWTTDLPCGCVLRHGVRKVFCAQCFMAYLSTPMPRIRLWGRTKETR